MWCRANKTRVQGPEFVLLLCMHRTRVSKLIGTLHFLVFLFCSFFFLIPKSSFDFLFLAYEYLAFWSWTMLNGQCLISYVLKRPNDASISSSDIILLFGDKHQEGMKILLKGCSFSLTLSIVVVLLRNHMNVWWGIIPLFLYYWLSHLRNPTIHLIFWFIFPFYIVNSLRLYLKSQSIYFI